MSQTTHIGIRYVAQDQNAKPFSAYEMSFFRNKFPPITDEREAKTLEGIDMLEYLQQNGAPILSLNSERYPSIDVNEIIIISHFGGCSLRTHEQTAYKAFRRADDGVVLIDGKKNVHGLSLDIFSDDETKARKVLSRLEGYILGSGSSTPLREELGDASF